jgi:hypothetical protein
MRQAVQRGVLVLGLVLAWLGLQLTAVGGPAEPSDGNTPSDTNWGLSVEDHSVVPGADQDDHGLPRSTAY